MKEIALPTTNFAENAVMTVSRVSAVSWCSARSIYRKGERRTMMKMKENILSYTTRIGKTTFIVNVKQSESAKKPLNTVFQEICRHEMLGDFSADKYLNLENLQKSS